MQYLDNGKDCVNLGLTNILPSNNFLTNAIFELPEISLYEDWIDYFMVHIYIHLLLYYHLFAGIYIYISISVYYDMQCHENLC